jgi:glycosyltransferase involved in cell wall biosynthesis
MENTQPQAPEVPPVQGPRVTVLMVSQEQVAGLRASLASLPNDGSLEVIVVDCGSRDGSARLDEEFPQATFLRLPHNFGWTRAFNIGTRTAKGEYLFYLPTGRTVEPDTIARLLATLEQDPQAGAVCPAGEFHALPKPGEAGLRAVPASQAEYPFGQAVLYPKLALVSINYFPDQYGQHYADLELFHKMKEAGKRVHVREDVPLGGSQNPTPMIQEATAEADRLHGLATYYGKNYGFLAGFGFWLGQIFGAALRFRLGLAGSLLSGTKVDGL